MGYVGRGLNQTGGQYRKLDDISSSFDGSETSFTLKVSNLDITPTAQNLLISINGVIQEPGSAYSMNGSTITFSEAPARDASFFGVVMGEASYIAHDTVGANEMGVTAGAVSASSGVVVDSGKNVQGFNKITSTSFSGVFEGALSSSAQIASNISGSLSNNAIKSLGAGIVSASVLSSPSQGTIRLATNGVNNDVDSGLQTGDSPTFTGGTYTSDLGVSGSVVVKGSLTAQEFKTEFISASILFDSGSTKFGDTAGDIHQMTGSLRITGSGHHYIQTGKVGIGTTTPSHPLEVRGADNGLIISSSAGQRPHLGIFNSSANFVFSANGSRLDLHRDKTLSNHVLSVLSSNGNVGIGLTNPASNLVVSSSTKTDLLVGGNSSVFSDTNRSNVEINGQGTATLGMTIGGAAKGLLYHDGTNSYFRNYANGYFAIYTNNDEHLRVADSGRVIVQEGIELEGGSLASGETGISSSGNGGDLLLYSNGSAHARLSSAGKLGIGTNSPRDVLDVVGDININGSSTRQIKFNDGSESEGAIVFDELADGFIFKVGGSSGSSKKDALRIDNQGNIGIGVTPEDWDEANAFKVLQLGLGACVGGYGTSTPHAFLGNNIYFDDSNNRWQYIVNDTATFYHQNNDGKHIWFTADSGTADAEITLNERMVILNSGNVGIGDTTPPTTLTVKKTGTNGFTSDTDVIRLLGNNGASGYRQSIGWIDNNSRSHATVQIGYVGESSSGPGYGHFFVATSNSTSDEAPTERFRILSAGQVSIGTSSPYGSTPPPLTVRGEGDLDSFGYPQLVLEGSSYDYPGMIFRGSSGTHAAIRVEGGDGLTFWTTPHSSISWSRAMHLKENGEMLLANTRLQGESTTHNRRLLIRGSSTNYLALGPYENNGYAYIESTGQTVGLYHYSSADHIWDGSGNFSLRPYDDNEPDLGESSYRWQDIYATNGTIQTSDEREKENIKTSSLGLEFINKLNPVQYKWKDYDYVKKGKPHERENDETLTKTHQRTHYGLIAQEVKKVLTDSGLTTTDFAPIIYDEDADRYGMRYTELVGILIKSIQELSAKVEALES